MAKSENTLPFFFWSSKMLYTNFYTSSGFVYQKEMGALIQVEDYEIFLKL
jgi:hypothetical protein